MAGYKETFGANVDYAYGRGTRDITSQLQRRVGGLNDSSSFRMGQQIGQSTRALKEMNAELRNLKEQQANVDEGSQAWVKLEGQIRRAEKALKDFERQRRQMKFDLMEKGLGKITKGLINMNTSILTIGFDFLVNSIKRVYELQERWTKAIGGFNLRIGGMTSGLRGATQAATRWSGVIRGLTDGDIGEGIQMFADFTDAIGRVVQKGDQFEKFGLVMARGFNLGGQGAGQLAKVFQNIGNTGDSASETIKDMIKSSNAAGIPVNMLAKDILDSSVYMARFGKEAQRTFVQGAAWARKFTISMEQLKNSVEGLDMFDEAARTASKLNTTFGTMINSMDLMLSDDPAQRLEMIRQQFLAQGMTFDKLTPKQVRYLSETLKLTEDQTAAILKAENAGESYADFQEKAAKREKNELNAKQMMEKQLRATAQTMYAFGVAFDRITVAIANAIKPLLVVLGLAKDGDKKFTSFGQVMESITTTVEHFFNSLAKNDKWKDFMKELANDMKRAGAGLRDFVMDGRAADLMGDIAKGMKTFYGYVRDLAITIAPALKPLLNAFLFLSQHLDKIAIAYGAIKGLNFMRGMAAGVGGSPGMLGKVGRGAAKIGGGSIAGGAAGLMLGGTGAGLGGMVGGLFGPLGGVIGAGVGKLLEEGVKFLFGGRKKTELEVAREELDEAIKKETATREGYTAVVEMAQKRQDAEDRIRRARNDVLKSMETAASKQKDKSITLGSLEIEMLKQRSKEMTTFGKYAKDNAKTLETLAVGGKLTSEQIRKLMDSTKTYEDELSKLRDTTKQQAEVEMARLQVSRVGQQKEAGEALKALREAELKSLRAELEAEGGRMNANHESGMMGFGSIIQDLMKQGMWTPEVQKLGKLELIEFYKKNSRQQNIDKTTMKRLELGAKIDQLDLTNMKMEKDLLKTQTEFMRQQTIIQLKSFLTGSPKFMEFMKSDAMRGKGPEEIFQAYMNEHGAEVISSFGQAGFDLLREGPNLASVAASTRPVAMSRLSNIDTSAPATDFLTRPGNMSMQPMNINVNATFEVDSTKMADTFVSVPIKARN